MYREINVQQKCCHLGKELAGANRTNQTCYAALGFENKIETENILFQADVII